MLRTASRGNTLGEAMPREEAMRRCVFAAALVMAACGPSDNGPGDTAFDWIDTTDSADPPVDVPADDASDPGVDPVVDGQGQFRVHLPSEVAPGDGLTAC